MALNRLNALQILKRALDLVDSPVLDAKERPGGPSAIDPNGMTLGWLQEAIDYFQKKFPYQATVKTGTVSIATGVPTASVPSDYILDVRDGLLLPGDKGRLQKKSLSWMLDRHTASRDQPRYYTIRGNLVHLWPTPNASYAATLYYYGLDNLLALSTTPIFPDDMVLVRYVWLCCREWVGAERPGTAMAYADTLIASLVKQGIGQDAEDDQIPLDRDSYGSGSSDPNAWMGKVGG